MLKIAFTLAVSLALAGCGGGSERTSGQKPPNAKPDATYAVRGEVDSLPVKGDRTTEFRVHHEAIDDFKDKDGKVVGMNAMIMDFPPAEGVDVSVFKKGDKVRVTFSVWWRHTPPWLAVKVEPLPPDTVLTFGKAKPITK